MISFGEVPASSVLPIFFDSYAGATGASVTLTGLAITDVEIYKGTSMTQRASDAGVVLIDTDGIDLDGVTGIHGFSIDLSDNTDASFYAVGSFFTVVVSAVTIDSQTVNFVAATFRIKAAEAIAGKAKVDVDAWLGTAAATPTVNGVPEVDLTHVAGATTDVSALATNVAAILVDTGTTLDDFLDTEIGTLITVTAAIQAKTDNLPSDPADASVVAGLIAAAEAKIDIIDTNVDSILVDTGTTLDGKIDVIDGIVDSILVDTAEIGAAGAGLTAIDLPNQTMNITGNITGNLSGSVGSVTGAVGSVTGAVGSVTGLTAADVGAIKAKTDALPSDPADQSLIIAATNTILADTNAILIDTADMQPKLGAPAGASMSADIAAVKVDTAATLVDTGTTLDGRIPAALTAGGNMKSDALAISGSAAAADSLEESTEAIGSGTVDGTGATTTAFVASAISPASAVNDQYVGRVMIFKNDTTTTALRGQATTISDFVHATQTFTVVALTTAPATGDVFAIL